MTDSTSQDQSLTGMLVSQCKPVGYVKFRFGTGGEKSFACFVAEQWEVFSIRA